MTTTPKRSTHLAIRPATIGDTDFILSLVPRLVSFDLPQGRCKRDCGAAIHGDIAHALREPPDGEALFVATEQQGACTGFLRLQVQRDFFSDTRNCHVSDLVVAPGYDGHGIGSALLDHAHQWARKHRCARLTLSVFPGNTRARALYARVGFDEDMIRMAKPVGCSNSSFDADTQGWS